MKLLYLNENLLCFNCKICSSAGFACHKLDANDIYRIDNSRSPCILFILEGEVTLDLGEYQRFQIIQNKMLFIPQNINTCVEPRIKSKCILLFWDRTVSICGKMLLESSFIMNESTNRHDIILPIKDPLMTILESIGVYLESKLLCRCMDLLKRQELLLVITYFYTSKELVDFFSVLTGVKQHFERFVLENYKKVNTVKEFADLYYISERSFSRKFHSCFGESPYKWMQKKKAEQVLEMVRDPGISLKEIAHTLGFSSPSHFTAYCWKLFGMPPNQLRKEYEKNGFK